MSKTLLQHLIYALIGLIIAGTSLLNRLEIGEHREIISENQRNIAINQDKIDIVFQEEVEQNG